MAAGGAAVALAILWGGAVPAEAQTWVGGNAGDPNEWQEPLNWTPATVPTTTATFGSTGVTTVANDLGVVTIGTIQFTSTAQAYTVNIDNPFIINGTGIVNNSTNTQTFNVTDGNTLVFQGTSSASAGTGPVLLTTVDGAFIAFENSSTAGNATITNSGITQFSNSSSAGTAQITNNQQLDFFNSSTAGNATITNTATVGIITFNNTASAGTANIDNSNTVTFNNSSTAGSAIITTENGATTSFTGNSTGGNAQLIAVAGGTVDFSGSSGPSGNHQLTAGSISGAGTFDLGSNQLTVGGDNLSTTVSGTIADGGASGGTGASLVKIGTGTLTLSGTSSYTGATVVSAGTLQAGAANALAPTSAFTVASGAILNLNNFNQVVGSLAGAGTVTLGTATLTTGGNNASTSFSGTITGTGALVKTGTGTFTLAGTNTYSGGTTINGGTIAVSADAGLGATTGGLTLGGGTLQYLAGFSSSRTVTLNAGGGTFNTNGNNATLAGPITGGGSLTKAGAGTLTLSGTETYTGATNVNGGTLFVGTSLVSSPQTNVNAGGTLAGTGTVGATQVNAGGTLAPGATATPGTLAIAGNLAFTSGAFYLVQVSPTAASQATVMGTASLAGTVQAAFSPGSYVAKTYDILHATSLGGTTFNGLTTTNLPAGFAATLSYSGTDVFLNLAITGIPTSGLSANQLNVASAINNFFVSGGTLPPGFVTLVGLTGNNLANGLSQLSGETATGAQLAGFQLMNSFMGLLLDPYATGRSGGLGPVPFAPDRAQAFPPDVAEAYASVLKAPPAPAYGRFNVWGAAYGGSNTTSGDPTGIGSHDLAARAGGVAGGVDYRASPDTLVGVALAGAGTSWGLSAGLGSGRSDAFQAGLYGSQQFGAAYLSGALAFANYWASTSRIVTVAGTDTLTASYNAQSFGGRAEAGYRFGLAPFALTPYAAIQAQNFHTPAYSETAASGSAQFALAYASNTATAVRSELGSWVSKDFLLQDGNVLALFGRAAWAHDTDNNLALTPTFLALPGASFVVNGAAPPPNLALVTAGGEMSFAGGWTAMAKFDGEFSGRSQTYSGTARVRYAW